MDLTGDSDGVGGAINWSQIEALVDDIWCIFNIIDDKSESDVNTGTKMTDVLCNIINHLKHNINVDSKNEIDLLNNNVKWIKKYCQNNKLVNGSIEELEINYQSKMISKMQGILEQCTELKINLINSQDCQMKIELKLALENEKRNNNTLETTNKQLSKDLIE